MYGNFGNRRGSTAPVKVGDELDVTIEAVGEKGDGIAKKDGFVLFVPGVQEGQRVRIRVTKVLQKVGFAEVVSEGGAPAESAEESEEAPAEESYEAAPESQEDSEDFGEEEAPAEEADEEASDEEFAEEPEAEEAEEPESE